MKLNLRKIITFFFIVNIFWACEEDNTNNYKIKKLAEKYQAFQEWENLDFEFTFEFQEFFSDTNKHILFHEYVWISDMDVVKNRFFIHGASYSKRTLYFKLECSKQQFNEIFKLIKGKDPEDIGLIAKINKISQLGISVDTDSEDEDDAYVTTEIIDDFIIEGKLVDFYIEEVDD